MTSTATGLAPYAGAFGVLIGVLLKGLFDAIASRFRSAEKRRDARSGSRRESYVDVIFCCRELEALQARAAELESEHDDSLLTLAERGARANDRLAIQARLAQAASDLRRAVSTVELLGSEEAIEPVRALVAAVAPEITVGFGTQRELLAKLQKDVW